MKVLIVEDSATVRAYLESILGAEPDVQLLPSATTGARGVALARTLRPDVILMDLELPELDGIQAIRAIMAESPCPIVVLSAVLDAPERDRTFEALSAGAADVMQKPRGLDARSVAALRARLVSTVRLMASAVVVRRRHGPPSSAPPVGATAPRPTSIVAIGASTGGPPVLFDLLRALPAPFPVPIVIAQHIVPGFERGLVQWLRSTRHDVVLAAHGDALRSGVVYVAPADRDLAVRRGAVELSAASRAHVPSVDVLFESVAEEHAELATGLLLTGMGDDGARGLLALRRAGGRAITQLGSTCAVDGMPAAARAIGASQLDLAPAGIAGEILRSRAGS